LSRSRSLKKDEAPNGLLFRATLHILCNLFALVI